MRIILRRNVTSFGSGQGSDLTRSIRREEAVQYVRTVFAHLTHMIRIDQIEYSPPARGFMYGSSMQEQIVVHYDVQPLSASENIGQAIRDAVALRGDLVLESLEVPRPRMQVAAIQEVEAEVLGSHKYSVHPLYAQFLARAPEQCQKIRGTDVVEVKLTFVQDDPEQWRYTGNIATETRRGTPSPAQLLVNPYHRLASVIPQSNSAVLRADILSDGFRGLQITVYADGNIAIDTQKAAASAHEHEIPHPRPH